MACRRMRLGTPEPANQNPVTDAYTVGFNQASDQMAGLSLPRNKLVFLHLLAANNAVNARPPPSRIPAAAAGFSLAR
jgi:hypothetical protein